MSETGMESEPWMDDEVLSSLAIRSEGWAREAFRRIQSQATELERLDAENELLSDMTEIADMLPQINEQADEIERLRKELWLWAQAAGEEF